MKETLQSADDGPENDVHSIVCFTTRTYAGGAGASTQPKKSTEAMYEWMEPGIRAVNARDGVAKEFGNPKPGDMVTKAQISAMQSAGMWADAIEVGAVAVKNPQEREEPFDARTTSVYKWVHDLGASEDDMQTALEAPDSKKAFAELALRMLKDIADLQHDASEAFEESKQKEVSLEKYTSRDSLKQPLEAGTVILLRGRATSFNVQFRSWRIHSNMSIHICYIQ